MCTRRKFSRIGRAAVIAATVRAGLVAILLLSLCLCTQPSDPSGGSDGGGGGGGSLPEGQLTGAGRNRHPCVEDGHVVWVHNNYLDGGEKGHPATHAHDVEDGFSPSLFDGAVAYKVWDGLDWEIRHWDGTTVRDVTDNDYDDTDPSLHGSFIAWVGRPPGGDDQIFFVDLTK